MPRYSLDNHFRPDRVWRDQDIEDVAIGFFQGLGLFPSAGAGRLAAIASGSVVQGGAPPVPIPSNKWTELGNALVVRIQKCAADGLVSPITGGPLVDKTRIGSALAGVAFDATDTVLDTMGAGVKAGTGGVIDPTKQGNTSYEALQALKNLLGSTEPTQATDQY